MLDNKQASKKSKATKLNSGSLFLFLFFSALIPCEFGHEIPGKQILEGLRYAILYTTFIIVFAFYREIYRKF